MTDDDLGPGVRRMRPDDHFMVLTETDATPMQIGALQYFDVPVAERPSFYDKARAHIAARLPDTPLLVTLQQEPEGYDSDVWVDVTSCDLDYHFVRVSEALSEPDLRAFIARKAMERLDLSKPPFRVFVFDNLRDGRCALYTKVHHSITDGIGFQTILSLLSDDHPAASGERRAGILPSPEQWRAASDARFAAEAGLVKEKRARMDAALEQLRSGKLAPRAETPVLKLSGPTSDLRAYETLSLPLEPVRALGKKIGGTVNDIFLALAGTAIRDYLLEIDDLPEMPIVVNSARSYRDPARHGAFGNRIVAMHPHLATNIADPIARLRAIQQSMANERARTGFDEALLDAPEKPFGPRDRRARFAQRTSGGAAVLAGNVTLSNVPGPAEERSLAGYRQIANYPTPVLGSGRFLNITSRRNGENLDMGIMADPTKIANVARVKQLMRDALATYEAASA